MRLTVGPLSPSVYWRRRAVVLGVVLVVFAVIAYSCSGDDDPAKNPTANTPSTVATLSGYDLPVPPGTDPAHVKPLSQQRAPMLYPSISTAWRAS